MKIRRFIILSLVVFCAVQSSCAHDQADYDDLQKISYYGGKQEKGIPHLDPCSKARCSIQATCQRTGFFFRCVCNVGYTGNGLFCKKLNPCDFHRCHPFAKCVSRNGRPICLCHLGYIGNGYVCKQISKSLLFHLLPPQLLGKECSGPWCTQRHTQPVRHPCSGYSCHTYAKCIVYYGRPQCVCNPGYIGDGKNCASQNNQCFGLRCHKFAKCTNYDGEPKCKCRTGYVGDGKNCSLDRCYHNNCGKNSFCIPNPLWGFSCKCKSGYYGYHGRNCKGYILKPYLG